MLYNYLALDARASKAYLSNHKFLCGEFLPFITSMIRSFEERLEL
jgi:hypothetical protein